MDIIILPIALLLFAYLAFQRWSALLIGPIVSMFVIIFSRLPMMETMLGPYMTGTSNYVKNYFLVFLVGALFGAVYEETKGAEAIAHAIIRVTKGKFTAPIIMTITGILTIGGISGFVVFFAIYPIALQVFRSSNLTRRLIPAAISAGCWTWSMTAPGSPSIQNVIPIKSLGTGPMAAPITGTISAIIQFVLIFVWLEWRARKLTKNGERFDPTGLSPEATAVSDPKDLPHPLLAFIPLVLIIVCFNVVGMAVEGAVTVGIIAAMILMWKHGVKDKGVGNWISILNKGGLNSTTAILNTAVVVGFASVVTETKGFAMIIDNLINLKMSPLWFVAITVAIAAGAAGSASGGMSAAFAALKDTFVSMGISLDHVHRVAVIASGTLDTLPHQGAQITLLNICGMTHKDSYFDIAVTQIIIPFIALAIIIPIMSMGVF